MRENIPEIIIRRVIELHGEYKSMGIQRFWPRISDDILDEFGAEYPSSSLRRSRNRYLKSLRNRNVQDKIIDIAKQKKRPARNYADYLEDVPISFETALIIPDKHHPFIHPKAFDFIRRARDRFKPDTIICIGDIVDQHATSKFTLDPDGYSAGHEAEAALKSMEVWKLEFPDMYLTIGNHDDRPYRLAFGAGLPRVYLRTHEEVWETPPGWNWALTYRANEFIHIEHGVKTGKYAAFQRAVELSLSVVMGHTHRNGGATWFKNKQGEFYGLNVGCLIDKTAYALAYGKQLGEVNLGCGIIKDAGWYPFFYPMTNHLT